METYLGENTMKLGFGLMRLPRIGDEIDVEQVKTMVDMFLEAGGTYFDTAFVYQGSEDAIRKALVERHPRESYTLATKLAAWNGCNSREDAINQFETSLERTGAGYFDYYLLHNLGDKRTKFFDEYGMWGFVQQKKAEGKIKHIGFSFHATPEQLEEILQAHPEVEFVQLQINYADWEDGGVQSRRNYEVARKYGKPVVVMEPVKGGLLASPPEPVAKILKAGNPEASYPSWAIRFAASLPGILVVLSGMSNIAQMEDNLSFMRDFQKLSEGEQETMDKAREALAQIPIIPCTKCDYCAKVCPMGIGISPTFAAMNLVILYDSLERAKGHESFHVVKAGKKRADACIKCGRCERVCPQHIQIRAELDRAVEMLHIKEG